MEKLLGVMLVVSMLGVWGFTLSHLASGSDCVKKVVREMPGGQ